MLSMWKYENSTYAYQTDSKEIATKLKRRNAMLLNYGLNCNHWVYLLVKINERDALSTFRALTHQKPIFKEKKDVWE